MEHSFSKISITHDKYPLLLREIPDPPTHIYVRGTLPTKNNKILAVVGSRKYSNYGREVVEHLVRGLRGHKITIVSGLALGIDALAHRASLGVRLQTLSIPGSGIDDSVIYPRTNRNLAREILNAGGALLSEYDPLFKAEPWSFPKRNRIMAGIAHATLVIEATERSGTLITARLTSEYNRELLVVPGNIFHQGSAGGHQFLKLGAVPVTTPEDILEALGIEKETPQTQVLDLSHEEQKVLSLLSEPTDRDTLIRALGGDTQSTAILLTEMELKELIVEENGTIRKSVM